MHIFVALLLSGHFLLIGSNVGGEMPVAAELGYGESSVTGQVPTDAQLRRMEQLIRHCRSPRVELSSLQAVQNGADVVIRGKGRNTGQCILASLKVRAQLGSDVDGALVRSNGRPVLEVPVGGAFSFELWFYDSLKPSQMRVWFALDDLEDDRFENDRVVPASLGKESPQKYLLVR